MNYLNVVGSVDNAREVSRRMFRGSPAYQKFVKQAIQVDSETALDEIGWRELPVLTKKNFYDAHPWREILPRELYRDIYSVVRSSGTTTPDGASRGFFWPQLKSHEIKMTPSMTTTLTETFNLTQKKTLAIVGLSLGSWAGGEQFSFIFKSLAVRSPFPLVVFSPGNQHREIVEIIEKGHEEFDQILVMLCPSAIFYFQRLAAEMGVALPHEKITYVVTGEPFPEDLRTDLAARSGHKADQLTLLSVYGSADTGLLGFESKPLIQLRAYLTRYPDLAKKFGFDTTVPNLYHAFADESYLEIVDGELLVTKWQGLPLVRYNLQDRVQAFSWREACTALAREKYEGYEFWEKMAHLELPDIISVSGRSQGCVFLCGSNIFESMLQEVFLRSRLAEICSTRFVGWTGISAGQQVLSWQFELKEGKSAPSAAEMDLLHAEFVRLLGQQQPEFAEDYEKFYRPFEKDGCRIFQFHFSEPRYLSQHPRFLNQVKAKVLIETGPI